MSAEPGPAAMAVASAGYGRSPGRLERILYAPAIPDWIVFAYLAVMSLGLYRAAPTVERDLYLGLTLFLLVVFMAGVYAYRLRFEGRANRAAEHAYHLLPVVVVLAFYFNLRPILPMINSAVYDEALFQIDLFLFGLEPTLALEPYTTPAVVEWFSFFYFSYFHFTASFVFVMIFSCGSDERRASFATGILFVTAMGHYLYTLVPGYGPYLHLAHDFVGPLEGGVFYGLVLDAVGKAGPLRDIFPSLHTAIPAYCSFFAWRHYPRIAAIASFFAANIIVATVVLRWHYLIDVIVGLALAIVAYVLAPRLCNLYQTRRDAVGLGFLRRW